MHDPAFFQKDGCGEEDQSRDRSHFLCELADIALQEGRNEDAKNYLEDMDHKDFIHITIEEVQKIVDRGHLGVKSGKGFFDYHKGA